MSAFTTHGETVELVKDAHGSHLEIDGKRVRSDEWEFVSEFEQQGSQRPSLIKSWWQRRRKHKAD